MNEEISRGVAELLEAKNPDGTSFYSDEDIKDVLPLLCAGIVRQLPDIQFPEFVLQSIGEVASRAGVTPDTPSDRIWPMLEQYYEKRPSSLAKKLDFLLQRVAAQDKAQAINDGAGFKSQCIRSVAEIIGQQRSRRPPPPEAAPAGKTAGPLARFAAFAKAAD